MNALRGRRVLLTRAAADNADWARRLEALGATVVELDCIETEEIAGSGEALRRALDQCDWLVLSSRRGVESCAREARLAQDGPRVACVGPATAASARSLLGRCDFESIGGSGARLGAELAATHPPARALLALAEGAGEALGDALRAARWEVQQIAIYRTRPAAVIEPRLLPKVDLAFLASPSAVRGLLARATLPPTARVLTLGPTTTRAARAAGLRVFAEARTRDLDGMLRALISELETEGHEQ